MGEHDSVEDSGPLTPEQYDELNGHQLHGCEIVDMEEDIKWYRSVLANTPSSDPAYARLTAQLTMTERYVHLKRRYDQWGTGPIVDLSTVHTGS